MVIKVYVSMISCSQEVKKNQQRALMILESKNVPFITIDITDPGQEDSKEYMNENAKPKGNNRVPMTPQIFNEAEYCGDFDDLDMANETDTLGEFLKLTEEEKGAIKIGITGILPQDRAKAKQQKETPQLTNGISSGHEVEECEAPVEETTFEVTEAPAQPAAEVLDGLMDALEDKAETEIQDGEVETEVAEDREAAEEIEETEEVTKGEDGEIQGKEEMEAADDKEADSEGGEDKLTRVQTEDVEAEA
ncbi:uncharacterized protein [Panulirus ornatus]|uniref:uncharacterized protein isoform X2 n=1 Tax=Panulirus ornatus TaxID=150431 RepID=UPI003A87056E